MKLYIPTSSLNLNNILSSESISPASFYRSRGFGYSSLYKVELNPFENSILLYSNCPKFEIAKSDLENHAMVIEVETDDCGCDLSSHLKQTPNEGVYQLGKTIYLNPYSTKIYFFSAQHYRTALSLTEQSGETKLAKLYSGTFEVRKSGDQEYQIDNCVDLPEMDLSSVCFDQRLNRIKGFAYAYTIAANRSVPKYVITARRIINEVSNLAYAIVNSPSGRGTNMQVDKLRFLLEEFTQTTNSPFYSEVKKIVGEEKWSQIDAVMKQYGASVRFPHNYNQLFTQLTSNINEGYNPIENALNEMRKWVAKEEIIKSGAFILEGIGLTPSKITQFEDDAIIKKETREYYQNLINDIFSSMEIYESTLNTEKMGFADNITRTIKEYIGEAWNDSSTKKYLNNLRRNIAGQEEFSIQWDKGLISAIAAFLLKGDSHEKLTKFLTDCEIEDGRLAFGFYGCTCGFANMSRVFTDELLCLEDHRYISSIYKKLHRQLHQVDLEGELLMRLQQPISHLREDVYDIIRTENFKQEQVEAIEHALDIEEKKYDSETLWFIVNALITRKSEARDVVEEILKSRREFRTREELEGEIWAGLRRLGKKKVSSSFVANLSRAIELEEQRGNPEAFLCILDDSMDKTDKAYKKLKKKLCPEHKTTVATVIDTAVDKVHEVVDGVLNLFPSYSEKVATGRTAVHTGCTPSLPRLIVDVDKEELARIIQSAINISNDKIIKNLKYVHDQHQSYERANKEVIRHFRNLCFPKDPKKTGSIEDSHSNRVEVDAVEEWLQTNFKD